MTELKFVPEQWCDEVTATPATTPNAFIQKIEGSYVLRPADKDEADDHDSFPHITVKNGDTVTFAEHRHFGSFRLNIREDRSWDTDLSFPTYANYFALAWDWETMADSIPELITNSELEPGSHDLIIYWWGDGHAWRFVVEGDTARFAQIEGEA